MSVQTLAELFLHVAGHAKPDCLLHKVDGRFRPVSTQELVERVRRLASALTAFGIERGEQVALMAENGPHWPTVDFATLCIGGVVVPIYPTLTPDQAAFIADDCQARVLFIQGRERLEGMLEERSSMPRIEKFILIDGESPGDEISTLDDLLAKSEPMPKSEFEEAARKVSADDLATFIYTSGTTGKPKGVMLTHGNLASNVIHSLAAMPGLREGWTALSFLPLSHSFERTIDYIYFYRGLSIAYAESVQAVAQNLQEVHPHVFVSVPRVYEKVMAKVNESVAAGSTVKQKIFAWAVEVARKSLPYRLRGDSPPGLLGLQLKLADRLVFAKIRARLGTRFEFAMSGGAPLAPDLAKFFWGANVRIFEGYGLSETSPVLTVNTPDAVKLGSVGRAIQNTELRIAGDGEILARGPQIMRGYFNLEEATAEAIDADGWFHTGDIGEIDDEGFLKITDRKKEIIVSAYGKNIAPAPIENALKSSRFVSQAVVIGDRRKVLSALLVPDFEALRAWAAQEAVEAPDNASLLRQQRIRELLAAEVETVNQDLARFEQIRLWELLPEEFTVETGELTPTQKVKRRVINQKYGEQIERMYERSQETPTLAEG